MNQRRIQQPVPFSGACGGDDGPAVEVGWWLGGAVWWRRDVPLLRRAHTGVTVIKGLVLSLAHDRITSPPKYLASSKSSRMFNKDKFDLT